jgi:hypothetical protein
MALKVIGAGYPRTGTASLKAALEQLGFGPCFHMHELFMNPERAALFVAAADGKPDWEATFDGYQSTTDAPGCTFWRELADYYPDAKVILSIRDANKWFESTQATVMSEVTISRLAKTPLREFFRKTVYKDFGDRIHDRDFMVAQFQRHREEVEKAIAKQRLLVFDARQGWEPLCAFLGVPVPDTPYPNTNSREEMLANRAIRDPDPTQPPDLEHIRKMARERFGKK